MVLTFKYFTLAAETSEQIEQQSGTPISDKSQTTPSTTTNALSASTPRTTPTTSNCFNIIHQIYSCTHKYIYFVI